MSSVVSFYCLRAALVGVLLQLRDSVKLHLGKWGHLDSYLKLWRMVLLLRLLWGLVFVNDASPSLTRVRFESKMRRVLP